MLTPASRHRDARGHSRRCCDRQLGHDVHPVPILIITVRNDRLSYGTATEDACVRRYGHFDESQAKPPDNSFYTQALFCVSGIAVAITDRYALTEPPTSMLAVTPSARANQHRLASTDDHWFGGNVWAGAVAHRRPLIFTVRHPLGDAATWVWAIAPVHRRCVAAWYHGAWRPPLGANNSRADLPGFGDVS